MSANASDRLDTGAAGQIRAFVARIERLEQDKKAVTDDLKEVYAEAKATGFDTKILRQVVRLRKIDRNQRQEAEALLEMYLGAVEGAPLWEAAKAAE